MEREKELETRKEEEEDKREKNKRKKKKVKHRYPKRIWVFLEKFWGFFCKTSVACRMALDVQMHWKKDVEEMDYYLISEVVFTSTWLDRYP